MWNTIKKTMNNIQNSRQRTMARKILTEHLHVLGPENEKEMRLYLARLERDER